MIEHLTEDMELLSDFLSLEDIDKLMIYLGGIRIYIPKISNELIRDRAKVLNISNKRLAMKFHVSESKIEKALRGDID